jgi:3-deoxy-D-manno-octulosonate 8-phosphate phosphatase KdsC-like HAD superfamily phosphatase
MTSTWRATVARYVANLTGGIGLMAIHLTPTELAREAGMERREVIEKCMEMGVPIFQGRIDKTLFLANLTAQSSLSTRSQVAAA